MRVEACPELKAGEPVLMMQRSLNEIEAQIAAAPAYNAAVTDYNMDFQTIPTSLVAGSFGGRGGSEMDRVGDAAGV